MDDETGKRIRVLRKQRDWTQDELASRVGLTSDAVSRHERLDLGISTDTKLLYARAFDVPPAAIDPGLAGVGSGVTYPVVGSTPLAVPMPVVLLLNDGRCNPLADDDITCLARYLADEGESDLDEMEIHLLAFRAERDRTESALASFRAAVARWRERKAAQNS